MDWIAPLRISLLHLVSPKISTPYLPLPHTIGAPIGNVPSSGSANLAPIQAYARHRLEKGNQPMQRSNRSLIIEMEMKLDSVGLITRVRYDNMKINDDWHDKRADFGLAESSWNVKLAKRICLLHSNTDRDGDETHCANISVESIDNRKRPLTANKQNDNDNCLLAVCSVCVSMEEWPLQNRGKRWRKRSSEELEQKQSGDVVPRSPSCLPHLYFKVATSQLATLSP